MICSVGGTNLQQLQFWCKNVMEQGFLEHVIWPMLSSKVMWISLWIATYLREVDRLIPLLQIPNSMDCHVQVIQLTCIWRQVAIATTKGITSFQSWLLLWYHNMKEQSITGGQIWRLSSKSFPFTKFPEEVAGCAPIQKKVHGKCGWNVKDSHQESWVTVYTVIPAKLFLNDYESCFV